MAGLDSFHQKVGKWFNALSCCKDEDEDEWKPVIGKPFDFRREDPCIAGLSSEEQEALRIRAVSDATRMFATLQPITHNGKINKSSRTTIPSPKASTPSTFKSSSTTTTKSPFSTTTKSSFSTTSKPSFSATKSTTSTPRPTPSIAKTSKNKWSTNPSVIGNSDVTYTLSPSLLEPNRPSLPRQNSSHSGKGVGGKGIRPLALITDSDIVGRNTEMGKSNPDVGTTLLNHSLRSGITSPSPKTAGYASLHTLSTTGLSTGLNSGRTPLLEYADPPADPTSFLGTNTGSAVASPFDNQIPGAEDGRRNEHRHYEMNLLPSPASSRLEGLDFDFGSFSGQGGVGHDGGKAEGFAVGGGGKEDGFDQDGEKAVGNAKRERDQDRDSGKYVRGR